MAQKTLEERIQILEDIEEIKNVMSRYCYYYDQFRTDELLELFTEDAELDFRPLLTEKMVGKEVFSQLYDAQTMKTWETMARHQNGNTIVEVDGNRGKGVTYMWCVATVKAGGKEVPIVEHLTYEDELVKENGQWKICKLRGKTTFMSPYEEGWVKTPMFDLQSLLSG